MEFPKYRILQNTDTYPGSLMDAAELSEKIGISAERIIDLAESGYMPNFCFDNTVFRFQLREVRDWISQNLMLFNEGRSFVDGIKLVQQAPPPEDRPPLSIANLEGLQQVPKYGFQPAVYFLCKGSDVVYIGQSVTPHSRVQSHLHARNSGQGDDAFDRVYLLPIPKYELNKIESAFISVMKPPLNGKKPYMKSGMAAPINMTMDEAIEIVDEEIKSSKRKKNEKIK